MKNILLALLMPLTCYCQHAIQIDSFSGVKFGASKEEAFQIVKNLGAFVSSVNQIDELAYLDNLEFAGVKSKTAYLKFTDDKFYEGILEFQVNPDNYKDMYNRMKHALTQTYGYGKDFSWIEEPYYFGDGYEFSAFMEKKAKLCHVWAKGKQVTSDDFILMEIGGDRILRIVFQNHAFALSASKKSRHLEASNK